MNVSQHQAGSLKRATPRSTGVPHALGRQRAGRPRSCGDGLLHVSELRSIAGAYSLVEVLIAGALLALGIAAAAIFANTIFINQESSNVTTRGLNVQEQAGRLYALGLEPAGITNLVPEWFVTTSPPPLGSQRMQFTITTNTFAGAGAVEQAANQIVFPTMRDASGTVQYRTNSVLFVRPTLR